MAHSPISTVILVSAVAGAVTVACSPPPQSPGSSTAVPAMAQTRSDVLANSGAPAPAMPAPAQPGVVPGPAKPAPTCSPVAFARRPLSPRELRHTLTDLLGAPMEPQLDPRFVESFPTGYGAFSRMGTTSLSSEAREALAQRTADLALAQPGALLACAPGMVPPGSQVDCMNDFLRGFVSRAYRRPANPAELDAVRAEFIQYEQQGGFTAGLRAVLEHVLASESFLFHPAYPPESEFERTHLGFGVAARLSYLIWETMPDEALWAAAARGDLLRADGFDRELRRLLSDPRARRTVANFHAEWLELDAQGTVSEWPLPEKPGLPSQFWVGLKASAERFVDHVFWEEAGTLSTFLRAPYLFADRRMDPAQYGLVPPTGDALEKQAAPAGQRFGLLTQPWFLALRRWGNESNPVGRGSFVQRSLLCVNLPPPPPSVDSPLRQPVPGKSTRERLAEHLQSPQCHACHRYLDPLGFGFENFDGLGIFRATQDGKPIDTSGSVALPQGERPFADLPGLMTVLEGLEEVESCVAQQWLGFTLARRLEEGDACRVDHLRSELATARGRLSALLPAAARLVLPTD